MNYEVELQRLIDALKEDKSVVQPWRNYAISDAQRLKAVIRMGRSTTYMQPPGMTEVEELGQPLSSRQQCLCPTGGRASNCPTHGML